MNKDNANDRDSASAINDPLTDLLKTGARALIQQAVEAELQAFLGEYAKVTDLRGRQTVVRNGYLPEREIVTGVGNVTVKIPKVRDRSGGGIKFHSSLVPPYVRKAKRVEAALPWLYLRGISTGDMQSALSVLLGDDAKGLSPAVVSRLKAQWAEDYLVWNRRDLSQERYVYVWADGIYSTLRGEDDRLCLLVIIGVNEQGEKRLLALSDGYRESKSSWLSVLQDLQARGLQEAPKLATGDGALGFWAALNEVWPSTHHQRCWVHKTANVLAALPDSIQGKAKAGLKAIWMAETQALANKAFDSFLRDFGAKYSKAATVLEKDRESLLAFYDFPAEHWLHIRTTNPIESSFATIRHRTTRTITASCKIVGGLVTLVDCCQTPSGSMGLGQYIDLLLATSQLDNTVMRMDATSAVRGAWETLRLPVAAAGDAWNSVQANFASGVNDLVGSDLMSVTDVAEQGLLDSLKGELLKSVAEWIGSTFGEAAGNALFSAGGQAAFDSLGNLTPAAESGGVQLGGGAAFAGQMLSTLMMAYTIVMIVIMIIQIVWSCEVPEYELAAKKQLKVCKALGVYCDTRDPLTGLCLIRKESYCCYNSPLARILNEQIKPQLGMGFGSPQNPVCSGVKVKDLDKVDWAQVNMDEWLAILAQTHHLPTASNSASMLNLDQLTGVGSRLNPQKYGAATGNRQDTLTRTQGRMSDLDVPTVKRQSELEGWGMGPQ